MAKEDWRHLFFFQKSKNTIKSHRYSLSTISIYFTISVGDTQLLNIWQQQFRPRVLGAFELTCALPNFVDPSTPVVWMKNGRRMPLDTSGRITYRNGNRKMIFSEITPDDRGWYTCVALDNSASYTLSLAVDLDGYTGYSNYKLYTGTYSPLLFSPRCTFLSECTFKIGQIHINVSFIVMI